MRRCAQPACLLLFIVAFFACEPAYAKQLPEVDLQDRISSINTVHTADGIELIVETRDGPMQVSPNKFVHMVERARESQRRHGWVFVLLNITSWLDMLWVGVGLLGQAMFTFRMVLQWIASEKERRSIIPVGFWWGSLLGGILLLTYFIWRKDIVGVIGQSTGTFIYARNLILIYRHARPGLDVPRPTTEPENRP